MRYRLGLALVFVSGLVVGAAGLYFYSTSSIRLTPADAQDRHLGQMGLINPLLECEGASFSESIRFKEGIEKRINGDSTVTKVSVYFRDLNNGPWFGINENEEFVGASLLKVAILMSFLKTSELNPDVLKTPLVYKRDPNSMEPVPQNLAPKEYLQEGQSYTVGELLRRMIIYSDNRTVPLLLNSKLSMSTDEMVNQIGMSFKVDPKRGSILKVKDYPSLFRILYNASYLSKEKSNYALELLTHSDFQHGLVAGLPADTVVAHKFGERLSEEGSQLHDCGIVYYPQRPYVLCVMTRGHNFDSLAKMIQDISRITYEGIAQIH